MNQDELAARRKQLWNSVKSSHSVLMRARRLTLSIQSRYEKDEKEYEEVDRQLAMLDGRFARYQAQMAANSDNGKRHKPAPTPTDFTEAQILEIAARLGITLPEVPNESE